MQWVGDEFMRQMALNGNRSCCRVWQIICGEGEADTW